MTIRPTTTTGVWVTAECHHCGRIPLRVTAFRVSGETYTYTCPTCHARHERPATAGVLAVLARATRRAHHQHHHEGTHRAPHTP